METKNLLHCKVIMLPTDNGVFSKRLEDNAIVAYSLTTDKKYQAQHLYFVSDLPLKDGDWATDAYGNVCRFADLSNMGLGYDRKTIKRVEATTNEELYSLNNTTHEKLIAEIPEWFIKMFVESGGYIDGVKIQMSYKGNSKDENSQPNTYHVKTNDNMVIIHSTSRTTNYYQLRIGDTSYAPEYFDTEQQAVDYWLKEYKLRNKGDDNDEYWNSRILCVEKVTKTVERLAIPEPKTQKA